jgi:dTMP kinase
MSQPPTAPRRGLFVAFEGGDGAGKSTQVRLLAQALRRGREVVVTRQPGGHAAGAGDPRPRPARRARQPRAEALLYAADKAHHVDELIRPTLARGVDVLTDRYTDSSIAYQGAGRDLGPQEIHELLVWAVAGFFPDLTIVVDVPAPWAEPAAGSVHDRIESEGDDFHERVRQHFLDLAAAAPERYLVLDGTADPADLHAAVRRPARDAGVAL